MGALRSGLSGGLLTVSSAVWDLIAHLKFWAALVATLVGVFLAFELERFRERHRSRENYARHLSAVRYELGQIHAICHETMAKLRQGGITDYEIDAPVLRGFISGLVLQEHAPHRLALVLMSLSAFVGAARNVIEHVRELPGGTFKTALLDPTEKRITQLKAGIENAQALIDEELRRLKRGVVETDANKKAIAEFKKATQA